MRAWRAALAGCVAVGAFTVIGSAQAATPTAPPGSIGHDVSHPQCGGELPAGGAFGIVGVNGGRAFDVNPCLAAQYDWAAALEYPAMVYLNTGNPGTKSKDNWPREGTRRPAACPDGGADASHAGCAYVYGWRAAEHAFATATAAGVPVGGRTWWLDVETMNSWEGDGFANAADLQGAFDYLRSKGVAEVGIYSTGLQWAQITGSAAAPAGYTASAAATFKADWSTEGVVPKFPMESAPLWMAGVTIEDARKRCGQSFTGGPTVLGQYIAGGFDHNLVCGAPGARTEADESACEDGAAVPAGYTPVHGTDGDDELTGTSADEVFYGGRGDDRIRAGRGTDILCGGSGRDRLDGGADNDLLLGDAGRDRLRADAGNDELDGGSGKDDLDGGSGRDRLDAGSADDELDGGGGKDRLRGGGGDDELAGGGGRDKLSGQAGRDALDGGTGRDDCSGGKGRDPRPTSC